MWVVVVPAPWLPKALAATVDVDDATEQPDKFGADVEVETAVIEPLHLYQVIAPVGRLVLLLVMLRTLADKVLPTETVPPFGTETVIAPQERVLLTAALEAFRFNEEKNKERTTTKVRFFLLPKVRWSNHLLAREYVNGDQCLDVNTKTPFDTQVGCLKANQTPFSLLASSRVSHPGLATFKPLWLVWNQLLTGYTRKVTIRSGRFGFTEAPLLSISPINS